MGKGFFVKFFDISDFAQPIHKTATKLHVRQIVHKCQKYVSMAKLRMDAWFYKGGKCGSFVLINKLLS